MADFIDFPIFTGVSGDLRPWISWLEAFFVREKFKKLEKMNLAQSLLEGEAESWFYSIQKTLIFYDWRELKDKLLLRFGDVADSDRIRLIADLDRFLLKQRADAKLRRLSRTAITPQESISSPATIPDTIPVDKFSNQQVDEISAEKKESKQEVDLSMEKIASQLKLPTTKVHVSDSENLRNIETRIENSVLDNFESVVKEAKMQATIRMDVVNGDVERIQRVMSITKNISAYQVFDKTSPHTERLKSKTKRKLSLSPKTWMFKFKNKNLQRQYSCSRAKCGYKWKEHNSRYGRRMRQTHMSRLLCNLQVRHDPKDWGQLILDALKSHMRHKWKSKHLLAVFDLQNSPAYALDVVNKTSKAWGNQQTFTSKPVASVHSLSFEVGTEETMSSGLSQNRQVWEPGGVLSDHVLVDNVEAGSKGLAYDGCVILGMNCAGFGRGKTELLATGQQMQRTDLFSELLKDSSNGGAASFPILNVVTEHSFLWLQNSSENYLLVSEFEKKKQMLGYTTRIFKYKGRLKKIKLPDTMFLWEKVHMVSCLSLDAQFHSLEFQLKHKWRSKHLYTMSALEFQVVERIGVVVFKDQPLPMEIAAVLDSFAHVFVIVLLVVVDRLSTAVHVLGLKHPFKPGWEIGVHHQVQSSVPPELLEEDLWIPEAVLEVRFDDMGRRELLVQWQHHDSPENSWMFSKEFVCLYHNFKLEDKLIFQGGEY